MITKPQRKTETIQGRVTHERKTKIEEFAKQNKVSISYLISKGLEKLGL